MLHLIQYCTAMAYRIVRKPCGLVLLCLLSQLPIAQASDVACITAGRLDSAGQWAPKLHAIALLDSAGKPVSGSAKADLDTVRTLEITEPALLSVCEGNRPLAAADGSTTKPKSPVPAAKPGRLEVVGMGYPPLRVGGELVEVKVRIAADQTVMVLR